MVAENTEEWIGKILQEYTREAGFLRFPIDETVLVKAVAVSKNIDIELREKEKVIVGRDEGSLLPKKGGFVLVCGKKVSFKDGDELNNPSARRRFTICHELAHVLFYDCSTIVPKCLAKPEEHHCHQIARKLLLPEEILTKKMYEEFNPDKPLIPFLRHLSIETGVALYPLVKRLVEDLSLLGNTMVTFWIYKGESSKTNIDFKDFRKDSKTSPELRRCLTSYWRNLIRLGEWNSIVREVAQEGTKQPTLRPLKIISHTKEIRFTVECETLFRSLSQKSLLRWVETRSANDVLTVEKIESKL